MKMYRINNETLRADDLDGKNYIIKWPQSDSINISKYGSLENFVLTLGEEVE